MSDYVDSILPQLQPWWIERLPCVGSTSVSGAGQAGSENLINNAEFEYQTFFRELQWTPDGSGLVTYSDDKVMRLYLSPNELLNSTTVTKKLISAKALAWSVPLHAYAIHPKWSLADPATNLVLATPNGNPLQLKNLILNQTVMSYDLKRNEDFISPLALVFSNNHDHFVTGSNKRIAIFDVNVKRPIQNLPTSSTGVGVRGIVSSLAISPMGVLAAGTFSRWIGLYDAEGRGAEQACFSVGNERPCIPGRGVSSLHWSADGFYLYVVERYSACVLVYDMRRGQLLSKLCGRYGRTYQHLGVQTGHDWLGSQAVLAGGTDGRISVWHCPQWFEGDVEPNSTHQMHADAVSSVAVRSQGCGRYLATCSGSRRTSGVVSSGSDFSVKIWTAHDASADRTIP